MKILLLNINLHKNITIPLPGLNFFLFVVFLHFNLFLNAQEVLGNNHGITLYGDAKIYSSDEEFNKKVVSKYIYEEYNSNDTKVLVFNAGSARAKEKYDLKENVKAAKDKKDKLALKEIKKKIDDFEKRKKSFSFHHVKNYPSSEDFFSLSHLIKDSVTASNYSHHSKIDSIVDNYAVKIALDFLYDRNFHYYNNKSLDFCFSQVFSVRPPPVLV